MNINIIGDFLKYVGETCPNFILRAKRDAALSLAQGEFEFFVCLQAVPLFVPEQHAMFMETSVDFVSN